MDTKTEALTISKLLTLELLLPVAAFAIPFFVAGPQLLTGSEVNALLILTAVKSKRNVYAVAILPSLGALAHGVLFGPYTPFLVPFLPVIWLSNMVLIKLFLFLQKRTYPVVSLIMSGLCKTALLFIAASFFLQLHLVPPLFVTSMGVFQFITAIMGGLTALFALRFIKK